MNKLFFTNRFYRKNCILSLKANLMKPIGFIQDVWKKIKLYLDYPDKWDRYVKLKEEENKAAEKDKRQAICIARSNFIGAAFRIMICQLYAISIEKTEEQNKKNFTEFQQGRKDFQEAIEQLERYEIFVSKELKDDFLETPINRFTSIEEWEIFSESFEQKIEDF